MPYSHLFFYTIYRNLCIVKKNAYKACNINVCREFLFINSFVIYTIYRNVSAVNKKSCNLSKIKGVRDLVFLNIFPLSLYFFISSPYKETQVRQQKSPRKPVKSRGFGIFYFMTKPHCFYISWTLLSNFLLYFLLNIYYNT